MIGAGLFCSFHKKLGNTLCVAEFFVIGELYYQVQLPSIFGTVKGQSLFAWRIILIRVRQGQSFSVLDGGGRTII